MKGDLGEDVISGFVGPVGDVRRGLLLSRAINRNLWYFRK